MFAGRSGTKQAIKCQHCYVGHAQITDWMHSVEHEIMAEPGIWDYCVLSMSCWLQTSAAPLQKLYLFHPSYTNVLLELRNSTDEIIAFNGEFSPFGKGVQEDSCCCLQDAGRVVLGSWQPSYAGLFLLLCSSHAVRAQPSRLLCAGEGASARRGAWAGVCDEA